MSFLSHDYQKERPVRTKHPLRSWYKVLLLAVFSMPVLFAPAQAKAETVTLPELLKEARENNPEIKAFAERIKAREARASAEGRLDDPTLKIEMEDLSKDHPLNISPGNAMLTRYTIAQMFPFPGKLPLKEKIAMKEARVARSELDAKELEVAAMVKEAYFEYSFITEAIKKTEEIRSLLSQMAEIAGTRYSTGHVSQQDVIKVNFESSMIENDVITLDAERSIAGAKLKSLLNRPQDSALGDPAPLSKEKVAFDTNELIRAALEKNPELKMLESDAEANELGAELAKKDYYPDFMVGVAPIQRDGRFDSYDLMFQINIPIWRGKYKSRADEARFNAVFSRTRLLSGKNTKGFEVKSAALQVEAARRMTELFETSLIPQVELSFESALRNYSSGKTDFIALLDTERELKKARIDYLKALLEYRKKVAALEKTVGADFTPAAAKAPDPGLARGEVR